MNICAAKLSVTLEKNTFQDILNHVVKYHTGCFKFQQRILNEKTGSLFYKRQEFSISTDELQNYITLYKQYPLILNGQLHFNELCQDSDMSSPCAKKRCYAATNDGEITTFRFKNTNRIWL